MKLVYIAGAYRGDVEANIARAREVAVAVWKRGHAALCPHCNSAHMEDDGIDDGRFLKGGLVMLYGCDAVVLVPGWPASEGAQTEVFMAGAWGLPIYEYPDMPEAD